MSHQHNWADAFMFGSLTWDTVWALLFAVLPVWALGALTGMLLPRPKLLDISGSFRHAILGVNGLLIIRELWHRLTEPGTLRRLLKAVGLWLCGKGWHFDFPSAERSSVESAVPAPPDEAQSDNRKWYVGLQDLEFFQLHAEEGGALPGSGPWETMMDKDVTGYCKYTAWRRGLPDGKTEYKSVTVCPDATAEEFIDLYFDDDFRPTWDGMVIGHEVLEHGDFSQRQQVVRWTRRFPFGFISDRQYTIARRLFRQGDSLYAITKGITHATPGDSGVVQVDVVYSMWRSRTIECPWGSGRPAVETLLLHHEQLKVPENLARFAVRHGMWGFVKGVADNMQGFIAARRARGVPAHQPDPGAFGSGFAPNPPAVLRLLGEGGSRPRAGPGGVQMSGDSSAGSSAGAGPVGSSEGGDGGSDVDGGAGGYGGAYEPPSRTSSNVRRLRGIAAFAIAGSLAILMGGGGGGGMGSPRPSRLNLASAGGAAGGVDGGVPEPRVSYPGKVKARGLASGGGGAPGAGSGGVMRRSVSVASALDQRRKKQQQYRFMQDPVSYWEENLTE